jgi:hypothetical protein
MEVGFIAWQNLIDPKVFTEHTPSVLSVIDDVLPARQKTGLAASSRSASPKGRADMTLFLETLSVF